MTGRAVQGSCCGFTMAEVLVSMLVASIALAVVPPTLRIAGRTTVLARDGTTAIGLAQAKLEELLAQMSPEDPLRDNVLLAKAKHGVGDVAYLNGASGVAFAGTKLVVAVEPWETLASPASTRVLSVPR